MGDQQETLDPIELGWLAGIIDGEGSITMNVRKKHWKGWKGIGVDLSILLTNTDAQIIERTANYVRRLGVEPHIHEGATKELYRADGSSYHNPRRSLMQININKMAHIHHLLIQVEPHLTGEKAARARLIVQFIERRWAHKGAHTHHGPSWYNNYDWALVQQFYELSGGKLPPEVKGLLRERMQDTSQST